MLCRREAAERGGEGGGRLVARGEGREERDACAQLREEPRPVDARERELRLRRVGELADRVQFPKARAKQAPTDANVRFHMRQAKKPGTTRQQTLDLFLSRSDVDRASDD